MGIIDTIKGFFAGKEKVSSNSVTLKSVRELAQASNYNQASIQGFYALETMGKVYAEVDRDVSTTAREYSQLLVKTGLITEDELEPIIYTFEVARYSDVDITFDDFNAVDEALENVNKRLKSGKPVRESKGSKKGGDKKRRRKRSTGAGGGGPSSAARRRRARKK